MISKNGCNHIRLALIPDANEDDRLSDLIEGLVMGL